MLVKRNKSQKYGFSSNFSIQKLFLRKQTEERNWMADEWMG